MWNFFRLENEHLNNCGHFRAIKDIPLPFHIRVEGDSDGEEEEVEEGEGISPKDQHDSDTEYGERIGESRQNLAPVHPVSTLPQLGETSQGGVGGRRAADLPRRGA